LGVKWKAMLWIAQECLAGRFGSKHAGLALDPEIAADPAGARDEPHDRLGAVNIEVIANDVPPHMSGGAVQQVTEKASEILLGPGVADDPFDLAGGNVEGSDQGLSAVASVLELTSLDPAWYHRQTWSDALQGLNAGHLVDGDDAMAVLRTRRSPVDRANVGTFGVEARIGLGGQPVTDAMRLEVGFFFKKRPTERCEMHENSPRLIASSAISRWVQWLIGRSLSDGFSQVIAINAQICSGVNFAGAPDRGASASRSGTDCTSTACRHRLRQYRTVFGHTQSSRALSRTPTPAAACRIRRARRANCCGVAWVRISGSRMPRCSGKTVTGSALKRAIATSRLNFRFVMPDCRRFDSLNLLGGVKTSACVY
jgi:hypothetical protein